MNSFLTQNLKHKKAIKLLEKKLNSSTNQAKNQQYIFQIKLINLMKHKSQKNASILFLKELYEMCPTRFEFKNDLKKILKKSCVNESFIVSDHSLLITDDPEHLLLMGSENRTCQEVDGDSEYNRGLLGPLLDGKYKLAVLFDEKNKTITARCLLRLLIDQNTGEGIIFREKIYSKYIDSRIPQLLNKACFSIAEQMEFRVHKLKHNQINIYSHSLASIGGPSSYEYVDALYEVCGNSYEINHSEIIYPPK